MTARVSRRSGLYASTQESTLEDCDPDAESKAPGVVMGLTPGLTDTWGSFIFLEATRDYDATSSSCTFDQGLSLVMAHELAHQFGVKHSDGAVVGPGCVADFEVYLAANSRATVRTRN